MQQQLQILALIGVIAAAGWYFYTENYGFSFREFFFSSYHTIHVGTTPVKVEVADSRDEQRQGLSGRDDLGEVSGLLMVFDEPGYYGIWMKDMKFPIDVIWIGPDKRVVEIREAVLPNSYPEIYEPSVPAQYILETKAYFADTFGLQVGDEVVLPLSFR